MKPALLTGSKVTGLAFLLSYGMIWYVSKGVYESKD